MISKEQLDQVQAERAEQERVLTAKAIGKRGRKRKIPAVEALTEAATEVVTAAVTERVTGAGIEVPTGVAIAHEFVRHISLRPQVAL